MISVIVPVYKVEPYLRRCLDSIVNQTYRNLEIILVNDGSPDNCGDICDDYAEKDNRIIVIHKENGGLSSARNMGIKAAKGNYIGFVDSDDWITLDMYETLLKMFEETDCDVSQISTIRTSDVPSKLPRGEHSVMVVRNKEILRKYLYDGLLNKRDAPFSACNKLYKKKLFDTVEFPEGIVNEDIITNYKLMLQCNVLAYTNKICYFHFRNTGGITGGQAHERDFDLFAVCDELYELAKNEAYRDIAHLAKVKRARCNYSILAKMAVNGSNFSDNEKRQIVIRLTKSLRKNYWMLIRAPMSFPRKVLMTLLCVNFYIVEIPITIMKGNVGKL